MNIYGWIFVGIMIAGGIYLYIQYRRENKNLKFYLRIKELIYLYSNHEGNIDTIIGPYIVDTLVKEFKLSEFVIRVAIEYARKEDFSYFKDFNWRNL